MNQGFDKEEFKKQVSFKVKSLYRKTIDEASMQQIFQAVCYAIKDKIVDEWMATHEAFRENDSKIVYYLTMEFLMGRALGNNLINMGAYGGVKEALSELGSRSQAVLGRQ